MDYLNGVPWFNPECGGCVSGDYCAKDCAACQAALDPALVQQALAPERAADEQATRRLIDDFARTDIESKPLTKEDFMTAVEALEQREVDVATLYWWDLTGTRQL